MILVYQILGFLVFWYVALGALVMTVCEVAYNVSSASGWRDRATICAVCLPLWPAIAGMCLAALARKLVGP